MSPGGTERAGRRDSNRCLWTRSGGSSVYCPGFDGTRYATEQPHRGGPHFGRHDSASPTTPYFHSPLVVSVCQAANPRTPQTTGHYNYRQWVVSILHFSVSQHHPQFLFKSGNVSCWNHSSIRDGMTRLTQNRQTRTTVCFLLLVMYGGILSLTTCKIHYLLSQY